MSKPDISPAAPAIRLVRFKVEHPILPSGPPLHALGSITCDSPDTRIAGWSLEIRGAAAFLVSPRGWAQNKHPNEFGNKGLITVVGPIPMAHITCVWEGDDAGIVDKLQRFSSPPFTRAPAPLTADDAPLDAKDLGDA